MEAILTIEFARYIIAFILAYVVSKIFSDKKLNSLMTKLDTLTDELKTLSLKFDIVEQLKEDINILEHKVATLESEILVINRTCNKYHG